MYCCKNMNIYLAHILGILNLTAVDINNLLLYMFSQGKLLCNVPFHFFEEGRLSRVAK